MLSYGVIADDLTGATDIGIAFSSSGFRTIVLLGSEQQEIDDAEVAVVALKTRTSPVDQAVRQSLTATDWLVDWGAERFYFKYCSTFDSTNEGNIGPVLDALMHRLGLPKSIVVPAFPSNGRTVRSGRLFVNGVLLEESPMRDHPLTPMRMSRIKDILGPQTSQSVGEITSELVAEGPAALRNAVKASPATHVVIDAVTDEDLRVIATGTSDLDLLLSGGSALAGHLAPGKRSPKPLSQPAIVGKSLVIAGSASAQTQAQIAHGREHLPTLEINPARAAADPNGEIASALDWLHQLPNEAIPLIHLSQEADRPADAAVAETVATTLERVLAGIASASVRDFGVTRLIVAGGETSGAVVTAMGVTRLEIGPIISPGVCWAFGSGPHTAPVALALKSGNFGPVDLFTTAWELLR